MGSGHEPFGPWPFAWLQYGHNLHRHQTFGLSPNKPESWTYLVDKAGIASPASVVGGIVYAGTNGHQVVAVKNGRRLWQVQVPNQVMTTPLVVHGRVIVGVGNKAFQSAHVRGTGWSGVMALNVHTGAVLWSVKTVGEAMPTPAIWKNRIYAPTGTGSVVVINWQNGHVLKKVSIQGSYVSMSSPLVANGRLFVGGATPYALYAISLKEARLSWSLPVDAEGGLDDCSPVWADSAVVVQYNQYLNYPVTRMRAIMMAATPQGKVLWRTPLGTGSTALDEMQVGQPTVIGGTIFVGSPVTKRVYALEPRNGHILWSTPVGAAVRGTPAIIDGELLVGDSAGRLDTLSVGTGKILRQVSLTPKTTAGGGSSPTPTGFSGSGPVIVGRTLYIVSMNGTIIARPVSEFLVH